MMKLDDFRKATNGIKGSASLWVLSDGVWKMPVNIKIVTNQLVHTDGMEIPESMKENVEIYMETVK